MWLPSPRLVSHGNNKREKGGVIRAGWEQCSGKPSFESTFFSKPQTRLPKMKIDSQTKTLKLLKIQLNCLYLRGLLSGWGKPRDLLQSPLNLLMSGNPSYLPYAKRSFHVLYQHTMHANMRARTPNLLSMPQIISAYTLEQSCCSHTFFFFFGGVGELGRKKSRAAGSPSLWFLNLKGGSASKLGAGQKSRWPDGLAREKGVSGA